MRQTGRWKRPAALRCLPVAAAVKENPGAEVGRQVGAALAGTRAGLALHDCTRP